MTLVVQAAYHAHSAPALALGSGTTAAMAVNDGSHLHIADDARVVDTLQIPGAAHLPNTMSIITRWIYEYSMWTDPVDPVLLPQIRCEGQFGHRGETKSGGCKMPGLVLDSRAGSELDQNLPVLECEAVGLGGGIAFLDKSLPALVGESNGGARADSLQLPALQIEATLPHLRGSVNKKLPGMTIEATGVAPLAGNLDTNLPALTVEATSSASHVGDLDAKLPPLRVTATVAVGDLLTLDRNLPDLRIDASAYTQSMTLDVDLPTLVMQPIGTGAGDGQAGEGGSLEDDTRFEAQVLRYAR